MKTKFKNGNVTSYGFACGLEQRHEGEDKKTIMYKEHFIYHVKTFYYDDKWKYCNCWDCFISLRKAKQFFNITIK